MLFLINRFNPHLSGQHRRHAVKFRSAENNLAFSRSDRAREDFNQGAFAGSIFPDGSDDQRHAPGLHSSKKTGLSHLWHATCYTSSGLKAVAAETAFRHELLAGCLIFPAAWLLPFPLWQALILSLLWAGVLVVEILNTALEAVVDLASPGYHPLAKKAKDLGSAAVGISLAVNALAWGLALWQLLVSR